MIAKMGWRLKETPDSLCSTILKAKYFPKSDILHVIFKPKQKDSWIWKGILSVVDQIKNNSLWKVGNGENIDIWTDY